MSRLVYTPKNINNTPANPFVIQNLSVLGNATIAGSLSAGAASFSSLSAGGLSSLNNVLIGGTLGVTGISTLSVVNTGNLGVTGTITSSGLGTFGSVTTGGALNVTGTSNLNALNAGATGLTSLGVAGTTNTGVLNAVTTLSSGGLATLNSLTVTSGGTLTTTNVSVVGMVFPISLYVFSTETGTSRIASPYAGTIVRAYSNIWATMTGGSATLTMNIGGTPVTNGVITVDEDSVAGTIDSCTPTALNTVIQGSDINFTLAGPFNGPSAMITLLILRSA
jgi:hypothetical protein